MFYTIYTQRDDRNRERELEADN